MVHVSKAFTSTISWAMGQELLCPFCKWGNQGSERQGDLPNVSQAVGSQARAAVRDAFPQCHRLKCAYAPFLHSSPNFPIIASENLKIHGFASILLFFFFTLSSIIPSRKEAPYWTCKVFPCRFISFSLEASGASLWSPLYRQKNGDLDTSLAQRHMASERHGQHVS